MAGESDADFDVIVKDPLRKGHRDMRQAAIRQLAQKWQTHGIVALDIIAMSLDELHDPVRRTNLFYDLTDGIEISGEQPIDLSFVLPGDTRELVELLCGNFGLWIHDVEVGDLEQKLGKQQLIKRSIRAIYGIAILKGAPYEPSWRKYRPGIVSFLPQYLDTYDLLCGSKKWKLSEILELSHQLCSELTRLGVHMQQD